MEVCDTKSHAYAYTHTHMARVLDEGTDETNTERGGRPLPHGADPGEEEVLDREVPEDDGSDVDSSDADDHETGPPAVSALSTDSSDEEDDTAQVEDTIGPAPEQPPHGFRYVADAPPLGSDAELLALVGRYILHAFDLPHVKGWFIGRIAARGVSHADLQRTPTADFVVKYDKKLTKSSHLNGRVASTLTNDKYGAKEWWMLLERSD